jgi:hypothetical protein
MRYGSRVIKNTTAKIPSKNRGRNHLSLAPQAMNIKKPIIKIKIPVEKSLCRKIRVQKNTSPRSG